MTTDLTTRNEDSQRLLEKWLARSPELERKGLADWDNAFSALQMPNSTGRYFRSVATRLSALQSEGLVEGALLITNSRQLLEQGVALLRDAGLSTVAPLWCTIQPARADMHAEKPSIKGEKLEARELISLVAHLEEMFPSLEFEITAQPLITISHQANIMVNSDRSVSIEVCRKGGSISRGSELLFRAETPPFQSWPFRSSSETPEALDLTRLLVSKIPRIDCEDGHGEEFKPGYYEISVGFLPGTTIRRVVLNDYRNDAGFTR